MYAYMDGQKFFPAFFGIHYIPFRAAAKKGVSLECFDEMEYSKGGLIRYSMNDNFTLIDLEMHSLN